MTRNEVSLGTTGRCWKLPDDVSSDLLISAGHVFEYDPRILRKHLLEELRPELAETARPGDLLLAGRRFAHGSQHSHPFIAMKEMGLGLAAVKLTRAPFRLAVYMGVPLLEVGLDIYDAIQDGDHVEVDYARGRIVHSAGSASRVQRHYQAEPLPDFLLDIVRAGGGLGYMRQQVSQEAPHVP